MQDTTAIKQSVTSFSKIKKSSKSSESSSSSEKQYEEEEDDDYQIAGDVDLSNYFTKDEVNMIIES